MQFAGTEALTRQLIHECLTGTLCITVTVYVSRYVRPGTVMGAGQKVVGKTPPGTLTSWHDEAAQICMSEAGLKAG